MLAVLGGGSSSFEENLGFDPGCTFFSLAVILYGDCREITIAEYKSLIERVDTALKRLIAPDASDPSNTNPPTGVTEKGDADDPKSTLDVLKSLANSFRSPEECFFFPTRRWKQQDIFDWFKLIGFTGYDENGPAFTATELLEGKVVSISDDSWKTLLEANKTYSEKMITKYKLEKIQRRYLLPPKRREQFDVNELIAAAMACEYEDMQYSCCDFTNCIQEIVEAKPCPPPNRRAPATSEPINYFAPYTVLLQSSQAGKTRFLRTPVKENKKMRLMIIYFTMHSNFGKIGDNLLKRICNSFERNSLKDSSSFLRNVYLKICNELCDGNGCLKSEYAELGSLDGDDIWEKAHNQSDLEIKNDLTCISGKKCKRLVVVFAIDEAHYLLREKFRDHPKYGVNFESVSGDQREAQEEEAVAALLDKPDNISYKSGSNSCRKKRKFDEVGDDLEAEDEEESEEEDTSSDVAFRRISKFTILRRAIRSLEIKQKMVIPFVLTSTYSNLSNFMPYVSYDPSRREVAVGETTSTLKQLHRVCILQESFDILMRGKTIACKDLKSYLSSEEFIKNMLMHGRPLFGDMLSAAISLKADVTECIRSIIHTAYEKLALGSKLTDLNTVALLGHTVGVGSFSTSNWASRIVKSKMGFLQYVDTRHGFLEATFMPEPAFAISCGNHLFENATDGEPLILKVLKSYRSITDIGYLDIGDSGEFVARIALYIAKMLSPTVMTEYDEEQSLFSALPVTFIDLLSRLGGIPEELKQLSAQESEYFNGFVSFNHFIKLNSLNRKDNLGCILQQAFCRGSAIILPQCFQGLDFLIPLLKTSGKLTWIFGQVKSRADSKYFDNKATLLNMSTFCSRVGVTEMPIYLVMNVTRDRSGPKITTQKFVDSMGETVMGLILEGPELEYMDYTLEETDSEEEIQSSGSEYGDSEVDSIAETEKAIQRSESEHGNPEVGCSTEGEVRVPKFFFTKKVIDELNRVLSDLGDSYRGAKARLTPHFAHFQKESKDRFRFE